MGHQAAPLSALLLALACACEAQERGEPQVRPAVASGDDFVPLQPAPGRFVAGSGRISVPVPAGPGWECVEEQHGEGSGAALALRCRRSAPDELFFFTAKTHRQPPDQRVDARTLLLSLYRADLEQLFSDIEQRSAGPATLAGASGWEVELDASHPRIGDIRKRERVALVGDRVLAVSAEGDAELWPRYADLITPWFEAVEFAR